MVFEQLGGQAHGIRRRNRAVRPDAQRELVVVGHLTQTRGLYGVIHLAKGGVHGVDGNVADRKVLVEVLFRRDVAAPRLDAHLNT